jgi:hypothetical protein
LRFSTIPSITARQSPRSSKSLIFDLMPRDIYMLVLYIRLEGFFI